MHLTPKLATQTLSWLVALTWASRALAALRGLPSIPNLLLPQHDLTPPNSPRLTVIVPACNEQRDLPACLHSLLAQDYPNLRILAVNDRSTDQTGPVLDAIHDPRLEALHITTLPPGWLGKTHAMAFAADHALRSPHPPDFLLFTDADVLFRPDALRRALAHAVLTRADHLVLPPTTLIRRWDEAALLGLFQIFGLWAARPWRIADPQAKDAIGIGAFNLIRTSAYQRIGGFHALRMEIIEDLGLARRVKAAHLRQRIVFGRNLVSIHWASGTAGLVNVMTKNIFSGFRFHRSLLLAACAWLALFNVLPFVALWFWPLTIPAALTLASMALGYMLMGRPSGISPWNVLLAPFAASAYIYALLRSMIVTLHHGGVTWRGTFYPLAELRKNAAPFFLEPL